MKIKKTAETPAEETIENTTIETTTEQTTEPTEPTAPTEPTEPTASAEQPTEVKTAEVIKAEIEKKTKQLQKCLADLETKKKLSEDRAKFIEKKDFLIALLTKLDLTEFEAKSARISICEIVPDGYGRLNEGDKISISNTDLVKDFIMMLFQKINEKIAEIEIELIK